MRSLYPIIVAIAVLCPSIASAQQGTLSVGGALSLGYNQLSQPNDPVGEPTLLFGSAFNGFAITGGATATYDLKKLGPGYLTLRSDVLFGYHVASGFAEHRVDDFKRELTLTTASLRIPALVGYAIVDTSRIYAAFGPELIVHFGTGASVTQSSDVDVLPAGVQTTGATHVGFTGVLGFGFLTENWQFPIELKGTWNPFVGASTRERFPDFQSDTNTGPYEVAFNWQLFVTVGVLKLFRKKP